MKNKKILHLNLKKEYFLEIKHGIKAFEFRLFNDFWIKKLNGKKYDEIHFKLGYPKAEEIDKIIISPYTGFEIKTITHPLFGTEPVKTFAIYTNKETISDINKSFEVRLEDFIDNNKKKYSFEDLPEDLEFSAVQGFDNLYASFFSDTLPKNALWSQIHYKIRHRIIGRKKDYYVSNREILKDDKGFFVRYTIKEDMKPKEV